VNSAGVGSGTVGKLPQALIGHPSADQEAPGNLRVWNFVKKLHGLWAVWHYLFARDHLRVHAIALREDKANISYGIGLSGH
jgi:hypothetical protein